MSDALGLTAAVIWLIAALLWLGEWWRARAMLQPLVEQLQQAIRDSEETRTWWKNPDQYGPEGRVCPSCGYRTYGDDEARFCVHCGADLVAR